MGSTASSIAGRPEETWQWTAVLVSNLISFIVGTFIWWTSLRKLIPFHPLYRSMGTAFAWVADVWRLPGYADSLRLSVGTTEFVAGALCMACGWIGGSLSEALVLSGLIAIMSIMSAASMTQIGRSIRDILPSSAFNALALIAILLRVIAQWKAYPWWVGGVVIADLCMAVLVLACFIYHRLSHENSVLWSPIFGPQEEGITDGDIRHPLLATERRHFTPVITPSSFAGSDLDNADVGGATTKVPQYFNIATRPL